MSVLSTGISAVGKLAALALLVGAFLFGLAGVVYMSLQGREIQVPEITGKDLSTGEKELAQLGLKIKKRADRASAEPPGTVIEQLPKAGEAVKTGQTIRVVTSSGPGEGGIPSSIKTSEEEDAEKIEEMISDKPKKPKANSNRKKADTARDINGNTSTANSNSNSSSDPDKKDPGNTSEKGNKSAQPPGVKPANPASGKPAETKPKTPARPGV